MNNHEKEVLQVVENYIRSVHTQNYDDFNGVWAKQSECSLISIHTIYNGRENIFQTFYQKLNELYTTIDLINDGIQVNVVNDQLAIVIFKYHTECIRRETNEPYGIEGLETQVIIKEGQEWKLTHVHYSK